MLLMKTHHQKIRMTIDMCAHVTLQIVQYSLPSLLILIHIAKIVAFDDKILQYKYIVCCVVEDNVSVLISSPNGCGLWSTGILLHAGRHHARSNSPCEEKRSDA